MKITAIDNKRDLFFVEDFYPKDLLKDFLNKNHLNTSWKKEDMQMQYPRRRLINETGTVYTKINSYVNSLIDTISKVTKANFIWSDTGFWLDEPGFCMSPHLDNASVFASMQIFLNQNQKDLGTAFYNSDYTLRFKPKYTINTGYIMLNNGEQLHGMENPVPNNSYRICSYTWFYPKT
jgi:hypothetical protein